MFSYFEKYITFYMDFIVIIEPKFATENVSSDKT